MKINYISQNTQPRTKSKITFGHLELLRPDSIEKLEQCNDLFLFAHPDDESCFFSFFTQKDKNSKSAPQFVYTTQGQKGRDIRNIIPRFDPRMGTEREKELIEALEAYDMKKNPMLLDLMDGETHYPENKIRIQSFLEKIVDTVKPKNVYTFDSIGMTGHSDHIAISEVASDVLKRTNFDKYKGINLWQVALTNEAKNNLINETKDHTHIFTYARSSITKPDAQYNIFENIPEIVKAFSKYKTQFSDTAVVAIKDYLINHPTIDLVLKR